MSMETGGGVVPEMATEARSAAWARFYEYCFAIIRSSPAIRRLNDADREDCTQEVMLEIVRKFGAEEQEIRTGELTGWIHVVSKNKAADIARRRYRRPAAPFEDGSGETVVGSAATASDALSVGESVSLVWEALLRLDQEVTVTSYLIFFLRHIEGWPVHEIAEALQITSDQVRFRCHRVKNRFAEILKLQGVGARADMEAE
jgi:RNA polymerase sigma factor (sigma-70 family)